MTFTAGTFSLVGAPVTGSVVAGEVKSLAGWQGAFNRGGDGISAAGASTISAPLEESEWILAAIKALSSPLSSVPLQWFDMADESKREPLAEDGDRSAFWQSPAVDDFGPVAMEDVLFSLTAWLALEGEAFFVLPDDWIVRGSRRRVSPPLVCGRASMSPQFSHRGGLHRELAGYLYSAGGSVQMLIPEQVVRVAWSNPYSRDRGLGAWAAASTAANADRAAGVYSRNVAASNGAQSEYIVTDGGLPSPEQQEQIVAALREKRRRAERGDFSPAFLPGGLKVQSPADRAVGAALLAARGANRESIAAALSVPLSMLQPVAGSSLGEGRVESEQRQLITNGTAPIARRIAHGFSRVEELRTRSAAFAAFDFDQHPAMRAGRLAQAQTAKTFVEMGFPLAAVSESLGLDIRTADEPPATPPAQLLAPADTIANDLADAAKMLRELRPAAAPVVEVKALEAAERTAPEPQKLFIVVKAEGNTDNAPASGQHPAEPATAKSTGGSPDAPLQLGKRTPRDKARQRRWEEKQKARKPFETRIKKAVSAVYKSVTSEALATLAREIPQESSLDAAMPVKALLDMETKALSFAVIALGAFEDMLKSAVVPIILDAYAAGTDEAAQELAALGIATGTPREVSDFLAVRENLIADSAQETFNALRTTLDEGFAKGETMGELAGRVKQTMRIEDDTRAVRIAVTETHTAFNVARQRQHEAAGIEWKEWLSAGDDRVRADHLAMDGVVMPAEQAYLLPDGTALMHPCAEGGPAGQVINCRCISIAVGASEGAARYEEQTPKP